MPSALENDTRQRRDGARAGKKAEPERSATQRPKVLRSGSSWQGERERLPPRERALQWGRTGGSFGGLRHGLRPPDMIRPRC